MVDPDGPETAAIRLSKQLRQRAVELDNDWGCDHETSFGVWCRACREQWVAAMREAADALTRSQQARAKEQDDDLTRQSSPCPTCGTGSPRPHPEGSEQ